MSPRPRIAIVLPAFNAARTLRDVVEGIPAGVADDLILVDDASEDETVAIARDLALHVVRHPTNRGYGANQKTCYREALARGADVVAMLHPDAQYPPSLLPELIAPILRGEADLMLGSRFRDLDPRDGGMPRYKYVANRALTGIQNRALGTSLSEFHTGYRAYTRALLEALPLWRNRDDFVFDAEVLVQAASAGYRIGEIGSPARYFDEASSLPFGSSVRYGLGVLRTTAAAWAHRRGLRRDPRFEA